MRGSACVDSPSSFSKTCESVTSPLLQSCATADRKTNLILISFEFSVINLVNILSVYTTAVFAALSYSGFPLIQRYTLIVPYTFRHIVGNFDGLNCQKSEDHCVLSACAQNYVQKATSFKQLEHKAFDLLCKCWRFLLEDIVNITMSCNMLYVSKAHIESGEALHCLA